MRSQIGVPRPRREDPPLITGQALYAGDHRLPGLAHLAVVRSPLPHGRVRSIELEPARALPGVVAAWSAADFPGLGTLAGFPLGLPLRERSVLTADEVRYVGEAVAVVVAETEAEAADAAQVVAMDLEALAATADPLHGEVAARIERGFGDVEAAFDPSHVCVSARFHLNRVSGGYIEPRATTAAPDRDGVLVHTSTQWVHGVRDAIAKSLGLEASRVRVRASHVGGAFGAKGFPIAEEVLVAAAALRIHRPIRWVATRSEDMLLGAQSHGTVLDLELSATRDGQLGGVRGRIWHPIGAYAASGPGQVENIVSHLLSAYRLTAMQVTASLVYTNTPPGGFIRGGGREVGNFAVERLVDRMADELGIDRVEIRRRNLVPPSAMPYTTGYSTPRVTAVFDGGDYPAMLQKASAAVEHDRDSARGVGVACFTESTGIGEPEHARVTIAASGQVSVYIGTTPGGQGHETAAAHVAAEHLGWPLELIKVVAGDSDAVPAGRNTSASRSAVEMGNAVALATREARRKLGELSGGRLDVAPEDIAELIPRGLDVSAVYDAERKRAYAAGSAALVVEVDVETGAVDVLRHVFVHDVGRPINPTVVAGQVHGGAAHGIGYALFEELAYDDDATPRTSGFLDYTMVTTGEAVEPEASDLDTPSTSNPEGFRGAGEGATIPVPAAMASAVEDALRKQGLDVFITELPISPERLRRQIVEAQTKKQEAKQ